MGPTVFVSSTYVDLRHVREHVSKFIEGMGFTPLLFEKGGIGFDWQKPIDQSCYDSVQAANILVLIIGGRYGSPATARLNRKAKQYNSITKNEYLTARKVNIPIYIFVESSVLTEHRTFQKNRGNNDVQYASVDSPLIFELIDDIYSQGMNSYIYPFTLLEDITEALKRQWALMLKAHIVERAKTRKRNTAKVNSFKLFYFRKLRKLSVRELAKRVNVDRQTISRLEKMRVRKDGFDGYHDKYFPDCEYRLVARIEKTLECPGKLVAGMHDDFLSHFVDFYVDHSGKKGVNHVPAYPFLPFTTKIVVFDFDGTIARHLYGRTTWEMIWESLGYQINECAEYHTRFRRGEISHAAWCEITLEKFKDRYLSQSGFLELAGQFQLIDGLRELVEELKDRGIRMYIVSGSIVGIIRETLGDLAKQFEAIKANEVIFDRDGIIKNIVGTRYDFQGKADFIRDIVMTHHCSPMDVLFVGNAGNDRWAANAGVRTLCVNPTSTDPDNPKEWNNNIRMMNDIREIRKFI
jgi:phosphoserine phosphatase/DNA-binding XRE family transcriptional regulator